MLLDGFLKILYEVGMLWLDLWLDLCLHLCVEIKSSTICIWFVLSIRDMSLKHALMKNNPSLRTIDNCAIGV